MNPAPAAAGRGSALQRWTGAGKFPFKRGDFASPNPNRRERPQAPKAGRTADKALNTGGYGWSGWARGPETSQGIIFPRMADGGEYATGPPLTQSAIMREVKELFAPPPPTPSAPVTEPIAVGAGQRLSGHLLNCGLGADQPAFIKRPACPTTTCSPHGAGQWQRGSSSVEWGRPSSTIKNAGTSCFGHTLRPKPQLALSKGHPSALPPLPPPTPSPHYPSSNCTRDVNEAIHRRKEKQRFGPHGRSNALNVCST